MKTKLLLPFLGLLIFSLSTYSQSHIWTGAAGDQNWFTPANWDVNMVPEANSHVFIPKAFQVTIADAPASVNHIDVSYASTLTIENNLSLTGQITIADGGNLDWKSATISGGGTIENNGLFKWESMSPRTLDNITINNNSLLWVTNTNQTIAINGSIINNNSTGVFDIASVGGLLQQSSNALINNAGLLKKTDDEFNDFGNYYLIVEIFNTGVIEVQEDQVFLFLAGASALDNANSGIMQGFGVMDITAQFVNTGTMYPGAMGEVGTLSVTNNFATSSESTIEFDINGNEEGSYDTISIVGFPLLQGNIQVKLGYAPEVGDEFTIINSNNINGCDFPEFIVASFSGIDYFFQVICNDTTVVLEAVDEVLGIEDGSVQNGFIVFPNPMKERAIISVNEVEIQEDSKMIVFNYLGQIVKSIAVNSSEIILDKQNLSGGLYFIQLVNGQKIVATKKLIIE